MQFSAVVELNGSTATGIQVPDEVVASLGQGRRPKVVVTIGTYSYRTTIGVMGGRSLVPLSAARRAEAGVQAGDDVVVDVSLDTAPDEVEVPDDLASAMAAQASVPAFFDTLTASQQRGYVDWVTSAKKDETRARRVEQAVEMLAAGRRSRT